MTKKNHEEALAAAEGVRRAVTDLGIAHGGSTTRPYLTVSVGVSTVVAGGEYSHELAVRQADIALYAAKARGRDNCACQDPAAAGSEPAGVELLKNAS